MTEDNLNYDANQDAPTPPPEQPTPEQPTPQQPAAEPVEADRVPPGGEFLDKDIRMWAMFCHLIALAGYVIPLGNVIGPLILWQVKKEDHPFVDESGKEALNFQLSILIYTLISGVLVCAGGIGILLLIAVGIFDIVFLIIAALKANSGEHYRYPLCIRFIK